jgi:hypothetical protein
METAVQWLLFELSKNGLLPNGIPSDIHNQANEIFEQQIIDAREALFQGTPEQYYKETFKSE